MSASSGNKIAARDRPDVLAADLRAIVAEFAEFLSEFFTAMDDNLFGPAIAKVAQARLDSALYKSNKPMIADIVGTITTTPRAANRATVIAGLLASKYGFDIRHAREQADFFVATAKPTSEVSRARETAEVLSRKSIDAFIAQTAHVIMGRLMLYRVAEDEGMLPACFSGASLQELAKQAAAGIHSTPPVLDRVVNQRAELDRFLPSIYTYSEFDWWTVPVDKRSLLEPLYRAHLGMLDVRFDLMLLRTLERLDVYEFRGLNVDIWHTVYQSYLPPEERQRLGGFYTPEPLAAEVLDEVGYQASAPNLCKKTFLDPACGSGTFVVVALRRLLQHLAEPMACHSEVSNAKTAVEKHMRRSDIVMSNIAAVDIHPFATFLTNVNVLFQVLVPYLTVKRDVQLYSLDLKIFAMDALDRDLASTARLALFKDINSRIQLSEVAFRRQRAFVKERFSFVFGNPPWGGVTKKKELAPVYDDFRKREVRKQFPTASTGKYDIFGAFIELAFKALDDTGRCGFVVQNTLLDKDWSEGLRWRLAFEMKLMSIVDLSKFGGVIFNAMNSPITIAFERGAAAQCDVELVTSRAVEVNATLGVSQLAHDVRLAIETKSSVNRWVYEARPSQYFRARASKRWDLYDRNAPISVTGGAVIADIYAMDQGVTPGGSLDLFMRDIEGDQRVVEDLFRFPSFKSIEIEAFAEPAATKTIIYPYIIVGGQSVPAFAIKHSVVADSLDFSRQIDAAERDLYSRYTGLNYAKKALQHRIAIGLVQYPLLAEFLLGNFDRLAGRKYKKKALDAFKRRWYEYIWPRDPEMLFRKQRLISPKIPRRDAPRFGLDSQGMISDDGTLFIYRHEKYSARGRTFVADLELRLGMKVSGRALDLLLMIWLNSAEGFRYVSYGKQSTAKGSIQITDDFADIPLPRIAPDAAADVAAVLRSNDMRDAFFLSRRADVFE